MTAEARRRQIVEATIAVVAEEGFGQASFARIASRAGLSSTRLISYHFADKEDLVWELVTTVVSAIGADVGRRVQAERTAAGRLEAYIRGVVEHTTRNRDAMRALLRVVLAGALPAGTGVEVKAPGHLEELLRDGQTAGEFRDFDVVVMALTVQRAVEALPFLLESEPELDVDAFADELVTLFDLATRRPA